MLYDLQESTLNNTNVELVKIIEAIKINREEVQSEIEQDEEEKRQIEEQMRALKDRLEELEVSLKKKYVTRNDFDKTIQDTEGAFVKILESSQTLLHVLKKEGASLSKKKAQSLTNTAAGAAQSK